MADHSREYPLHPIPCAAAIVFREETVLLIQRGKEPNYGQWSFPGGAMELGETSQGCALREVREETGLEVEILEVAAVVDRVFRDETDQIQYQYLIVDYIARPVAGTLLPASDVLQVAWAPFEEAFEYDLAPPSGEVLRKAIPLWRKIRTSLEFA